MPHCYLVFLLLGGAKEELLCFGASDQKKNRLLWIPDIFLEQSIPLIMHCSLQTSLLQ